MGTPGLRLIQDLLAKSVAKWSEGVVVKTEDAENGESKTFFDKSDLRIEPNNTDIKHDDKQESEASIASSDRGDESRGCMNVKEMKMEYSKIDTSTSKENDGEESLISMLLKKSVSKYSENLEQVKQEWVEERNVIESEAKKLGVKSDNKEVQDRNIIKGQTKHSKPKNVELKIKSINGKSINGKSISKATKNGMKGAHRTIHTKNMFSPGEDKKIYDAMNSFGDNLNITRLAEEMGRTPGSVHTRVKRLKSGRGFKRVCRMFSLLEDKVIMDTVLPGLLGQTLKELSLPSGGETHEVAIGLGRNGVDLVHRWSGYLRLWILQHYSGTLNLDIRRMLANHLNETYDSINTIDWPVVAERPEFVGHTIKNLRNTFFTVLFQSAEHHEKLGKAEVTLEKIAENANIYFSEENCRKVTEKVFRRQKQVIEYFEQFVKKHGIINF